MKIFLQSDEELLKIWSEKDISYTEQILGIEFPFIDGTYHSDVDFSVTPDFDESQPVDRSKFRKLPECRMPKSYPCIMVRFHEDTVDRLGSITLDFFDFVYPEDMQKNSLEV